MHAWSRFPSSRRLLLIGVVALASIPSTFAVSAPPVTVAGGACPPGFEIARSENEASLPADALPQYQGPAEMDLFKRFLEGTCVPIAQPETFTELALMNAARASQDSAPFSAVHPKAQLVAIRQGRALARRPSRIAGTKGRWRPLGKGPLRADVEGYSVTALDWKALSGRISDFTYDPKTRTLWTAVANGGVWMSKDLGDHWRSVGEKLPTQVVGSVAFSPAGRRGVLVAATGDNGWGGTSLSGLGVYRNVVGSKRWRRAKGVPAGALGFKVAVDPKNAKIVYAATSFGLYRSTNAGKSFKNVKLPTGEERCIGHPYRKGCYLRNHVTDVVVQGPDDFGNEGGRVLAAVGWRGGTKENADGSVQATDNGLYGSDSGKPGSFTKLAATGFTPQDQIGRIELGAATGPEQDHNYVYAIVQDAVKFNGGAPVLDANENPAGPIPFTTVLDGIYVSPDFGATWIKMADASELQAPGTGSSLTGAGAASLYQPGVQAWYNEWIQPDPTRQINGIPTRLTFGLEEVWQNELPVPQAAKSQFKVIGRYWGACQMRDTGLPACPTDRPPFEGTTTHPDQHGAIYVDDLEGGVTLLVGNDGGVYKQHTAEGEEFDNGKWGAGAQAGLHTLLPYDARIAKDGTVWAGLQDNGQIKITPNGEQIMTYGGDGFYAAVDPKNSDIAYEEYISGAMSVTTDGGKTWRDIDPGLTNAAFATPFMMDPKDPKHLIIGGRDVKVTVTGEQTTSETWRTVYDLGTQKNPGVADAVATADDPDNRLSAVDLHGKNAYVGYCGWCDVITQGVPFENGVATNVAGGKAPVKGGPEGWHIAKAKGLPNRFITSIEIDPKKPKTIYLTLAGYSSRRWAAPGAAGEKAANVGKGHVFKSTNAGKSFKNISGNLPNTPANYVIRRGKQLIAATDIGVFISKNLKGKKWARLGKGLPTAPVVSLQLKPGNPKIMVVASYGRGVYEYRFK
jgi:hypothetical protein